MGRGGQLGPAALSGALVFFGYVAVSALTASDWTRE